MADNWTSTDVELPPEGVPVLAMDSSGHVQTLVRRGSLWFHADMKMYVYYTPRFWRYEHQWQLAGAGRD